MIKSIIIYQTSLIFPMNYLSTCDHCATILFLEAFRRGFLSARRLLSEIMIPREQLAIINYSYVIAWVSSLSVAIYELILIIQMLGLVHRQKINCQSCSRIYEFYVQRQTFISTLITIMI